MKALGRQARRRIASAASPRGVERAATTTRRHRSSRRSRRPHARHAAEARSQRDPRARAPRVGEFGPAPASRLTRCRSARRSGSSASPSASRRYPHDLGPALHRPAAGRGRRHDDPFRTPAHVLRTLIERGTRPTLPWRRLEHLVPALMFSAHRPSTAPRHGGTILATSPSGAVPARSRRGDDVRPRRRALPLRAHGHRILGETVSRRRAPRAAERTGLARSPRMTITRFFTIASKFSAPQPPARPFSG